MKTLKKALLILAIVIAIPLIAALFVKREFTSERQITINKPKQEVFDYIKHLSNQKNYDAWHKMDLEAKTDDQWYRGRHCGICIRLGW